MIFVAPATEAIDKVWYVTYRQNPLQITPESLKSIILAHFDKVYLLALKVRHRPLSLLLGFVSKLTRLELEQK